MKIFRQTQQTAKSCPLPVMMKMRFSITFLVLYSLAQTALPEKIQNIQDLQKLAEGGDSNAQCLLGLQEMIGGELYDPRIIDTVTVEQILLNKVEKWNDQIEFFPQEENIWQERNKTEIRSGKKTETAFKWIKKSADQGNRIASFCLGRMYSRGIGVPKNNIRAFDCYKQSASQNFQGAFRYLYALCNRKGDTNQAIQWLMDGMNANSLDCMAVMGANYTLGYGVEKDETRGFNMIQDAYQKGSKSAPSLLARCYVNGVGTRTNIPKGFELAKEASCLNLDGKLLLGLMYLKGVGTQKDQSKGISLIEEVAATGGSPGAKTILANACATGEGIPFNTQRALELYEEAAQEGNAEAMWRLGEMYYYGRRVGGDRNLARNWLQKGKERGNKDAAMLLEKMEQHQTKLAKNDPEALYIEGMDILDKVVKNKSPAEGIQLLKEAANAGSQAAVARLGYEYSRGKYVAKDLTKAKELYLQASENNQILGLSGLGSMYLSGEGVAQDRQTAFNYFKKAVDLGSTSDRENLAFCYFMGFGVNQDFEKALSEYISIIKLDSFNSETLDISNTKERSRSLTHIGYIYSFILKDPLEGNQWFSRAISIENPYDEAFYYLGMAFYKGEGIDQNKEKGIELIKKGKAMGNSKCIEALKSLNIK